MRFGPPTSVRPPPPSPTDWAILSNFTSLPAAPPANAAAADWIALLPAAPAASRSRFAKSIPVHPDMRVRAPGVLTYLR
jgi:hypothetical protein